MDRKNLKIIILMVIFLIGSLWTLVNFSNNLFTPKEEVVIEEKYKGGYIEPQLRVQEEFIEEKTNINNTISTASIVLDLIEKIAGIFVMVVPSIVLLLNLKKNNNDKIQKTQKT